MADHTRWVLGRASTGRFQRYRNRITPRNENAFSKKVVPHPTAATIKPPMAGPTALATLKPAEFRATAEACCFAGTNSGVIACHAGSFITAPRPSRNVNSSSTHGPTQLV